MGARAPDSFPRTPENFTPMLVDGTDLDGTERRFATIALRGDGVQPLGFVAVGRRTDTLSSEASGVFRTELALLGFAALAMLAFASAIAHMALSARKKEVSG